MVWLSHHHFEGLRERIFESEELQRELTALLQQDLSVLSSKLDTICSCFPSPTEPLSLLCHAL